jgi:hypothetical protein
MRQYHNDATEEPQYRRPLTAHELRRARARLAAEMLALVATDIDDNAPVHIQVLVAGTLDAVGLLHKFLSARDIAW